MLNRENVSKIEIEFDNNYDCWEIKIEDDKCTSYPQSTKELKDSLWYLLLKSYAKSYKHDKDRLDERDKKRIDIMCEDFIKNIKNHMEYIIDNFYIDKEVKHGLDTCKDVKI